MDGHEAQERIITIPRTWKLGKSRGTHVKETGASERKHVIEAGHLSARHH